MHDEKPAYLHHGDTEIELPVVRGTEDELGVDIAKLRAQSGLITLDYGFVNTGSCESAITYIDGEAGILRYRGIPIEELVSGHSPSFLETAYPSSTASSRPASSATTSAARSASTRCSMRTRSSSSTASPATRTRWGHSHRS